MGWGYMLVGLAMTVGGAADTSTASSGPGRLEILSLESGIFGNVRELRVWLPPGYETDGGSRRYPVLYLNDGQNLFDATTAVFGDTEWGVDETLGSLIESGRIEPIIVVGIDNAGPRGRAREYLPYPDPFLDPPEPDPLGRLYGDFLANEVIPLVEDRFRVSRRREERMLGGSSYGALVSLSTAVTRPDLFSGLLLESPSFYVDDDHVLRDVEAAGLQVSRVYVGVGTNELALEGCPDHPGNAEAVNGVLRLAEILRSRGFGDDALRVRIQECAIHHESAWADRLPAALQFLFATRASSKGLGAAVEATAAPADGRGEIDTGEDTRVLVVATVHAQHRRNPNYTYEDVVHILDTFQPDVVCVEIRPEDFRREPYLKEMMLATVWGLVHERPVCGFDWFDGTAREARRQLERTPEYVEKARLLDSLNATNPIIRPFDEKYGDFWRGEMGYRFYNGRAYNRYYEEAYRLSLAVYGDDPVNLFYERRNRRMMDQAWEVISRHPGARVALLTGAEHKHYFDRDLRAREGVDVVELDDLLPLDRPPLHPVIHAFLEDEDDLPYYQEGFPLDTARYYAGKVTGLIHGPDMDWLPDIIPERNVRVAGKVLARWRAAQPVSHRMTFDEAWFHLLDGDCDAAVEDLSELAEDVERGRVESPFVAIYTYRNLGLCHDLLGNRPDALRAYSRARTLAEGTPNERNLDLMLRDYETTPYARGRAREPFGRSPEPVGARSTGTLRTR